MFMQAHENIVSTLNDEMNRSENNVGAQQSNQINEQ